MNKKYMLRGIGIGILIGALVMFGATRGLSKNNKTKVVDNTTETATEKITEATTEKKAEVTTEATTEKKTEATTEKEKTGIST